ncbi:SAM 1 domain containing protein, partial [Asbolus verrucosus]
MQEFAQGECSGVLRRAPRRTGTCAGPARIRVLRNGKRNSAQIVFAREWGECVDTMAGNIVAEWLRSLHLGQYSESFIDNGYDDLEICKQVGDPDLDAIGVFNPVHRSRLLQSVRTLREEGAASVYFTLEESAAVHEECLCDNVSARSSRTSSGRSEKDPRVNASPAASSDGAQEAAKYLDEYEEGKAELVKIPRMQLKMLLREKLAQDGIRLDCQPYSTP